MAVAIAIAMAMAMATAMAVAVIRPEHAIGADLHENRLFIEKRCFSTILVISEPSRPENGYGQVATGHSHDSRRTRELVPWPAGRPWVDGSSRIE